MENTRPDFLKRCLVEALWNYHPDLARYGRSVLNQIWPVTRLAVGGSLVLFSTTKFLMFVIPAVETERMYWLVSEPVETSIAYSIVGSDD